MLREAHAYREENLRLVNEVNHISEAEDRKLEPYADDSLNFVINDNGYQIGFEQLLNLDSLKEEGEALHHCVGGYASKCGQGESAIVSMRRNGRRTITIEMDRENRKVTQVRGKYNRSPSRTESAWIIQWCEAVGAEFKPTSC